MTGVGRSGRDAGAVRRLLKQAALAVTFLTGIPLPAGDEATPADLWRSMGWYPLVGMALGGVALGAFAAARTLLPGLVAAVVVIALMEILTRGLHMDGLMDTADGVLSGAPRERALEIMKDSRSGAMGVLAAILLIALKVTSLGALGVADAIVPLLVGWSTARLLPPIGVLIWPYARADGTGAAFARERTIGPVVLAAGLVLAALVVAALVSVVFGGAGGWWGGIAVAAACLVVVLGVQALVAGRLGGLTGDVHGMGIELAEAVALLVGCVLAR